MKTIILVAIASILGYGLTTGLGISARERAMLGTHVAPSMAMCEQIMADKQKLQAQMKAMDEKLETLVAAMDRAEGSDKTSVVAVREMVEQRKMMHAELAKSDSAMIGHMKLHGR